MAETKYGKHFVTEPRLREKANLPPQIAPSKAVLQSGPHFGASNFSMCWECITEPMVMDSVPHSHDYDEFLAFFGSNAQDVFDFDAEIEIFVGEEGEKHIIDKATVFYIPKGLVHCPVVYKRIGKPVLFHVIALAPDYYDSATTKKFFVREGERDNVIADLKKLIEGNYSPSLVENAKAYLKELEQ